MASGLLSYEYEARTDRASLFIISELGALSIMFSVNPSGLDTLLAYIDNQEKHHKARTFQEEYREYLTEYGVPCDERYVWD